MGKGLGCLVVLVNLFCGCGMNSGGNSAGSISAPTLTGSDHAGAFVTMVPVDLSVNSSTLYYYDYAKGSMSQVGSADGRDPIAIWNQTKKVVFYVARGQKSYRALEYENGAASVLKTGTLTAVDEGDPTSWTELAGGSMLMASLHEGSVRSVEVDTGYLSEAVDVSSVDFSAATGSINPTSVVYTGSQVWLVSSGVDFVASTPAVKGHGVALALTDSGQVSTTQPTKLTASHPVYAKPTVSKQSVRFLGLCSSNYSGTCQSGADEIQVQTGVRTSLASFDLAGYEYFSTIVPGSTDDLVYAQVIKTATNQTMVVELNIVSGSVKEIYTLEANGLSMLLYDQGSDYLLIGDRENGHGVMKVFKANTLENTVVTPEVPWQAAAVSSL